MTIGRGSMSALELLELGDADRPKSFLNAYWPTILGVFSGIVAGVTINGCTRRPQLSGIHKHVIATCLITPVYQWFWDYRLSYYAEKDMVIRHYVELHPEDFPKVRRKKLANVFEEWVPIR